jgi:hypothetical protein
MFFTSFPCETVCCGLTQAARQPSAESPIETKKANPDYTEMAFIT